MGTRVRRRFTIADGMILVAASAVGLLLVREYAASLHIVYRRASASRLLEVVEGVSECLAAAGMVALIPIRLQRPRPGLRRLARQPGFAACCALAAVLALGFLQGLVLVLFRDVQKAWGGTWPFQQLWEIGVAFRGPFAVAGAWLVLLLSGRWRAEPSWVDRLGRFLGMVWLVWPLVYAAEPWLLLHLPAY